jgi:murein tripeptide amidase MpaA
VLRRFSLVLVVTVAAVLARGVGQPLSEEVRYDGYRIVHVELSSAAQLEALLEAGAVPLNCAIGAGPMDFAVPPAGLEALEGLAARILHADAQALIDAEAARVLAAAEGAIAGGDVCDPTWFDDFRPLEEIQARLQALADAYPDYAEVFTAGLSLEGREMTAIRITSPGGPATKPAILFNGCQHAREWVAPTVPMFIATHLLCDAASDPQVQALLEATEFIIMPVVNPDGYDYSWPPGDRFWRKNRRNNGDGSFGVDLNRNWEFGWGGGGSSGDPGSDVYRGPAPFSESETTVLKTLFEANPHIVATIDFHSYSQLVLSPWAYTFDPTPDADAYQDLGDSLSDAIASVHGKQYVAGPVSTTLYQASGASVDWTYGERGAWSFTIELRDTGQYGFLLPPEQILPTAEENYAAALALAEWVTQGVAFTYPGGLPDVVPADTSTPVMVTISAVSSGPLDAASANLYVQINEGESFNPIPLTPMGDGLYEGVLPAAPCGSTIDFYFQIESEQGATYSSPSDAPAVTYQAESLETALQFVDDFESDLGWTVENSGDLTDGAWDRGVPAGGGDRGDPPTDGDGSGQCYLTDNVDGNSDVDGGSTTLISPLLDASDPDSYIEYLRWYSNDTGNGANEDSMLVEITDDGGSSWSVLEDVSENANAWVARSFRVADFVTPTDQLRVRFTASDYNAGSVVEAGVDGVSIAVKSCSDGGSPDVNGDGAVDVQDLVEIITSWGPCPGCPADVNGDGSVDVADLVLVITGWGG